MNGQFRVAIIGGGISGLSCAWYLQKQAAQRGIALEYTLLEQAPRWGGKILTEQVDGFSETPFVVEAGPDSFLTQKPWALQLAGELGLNDCVLGTNDAMRNIFVLNKGKPEILPEGILLIVPTRFKPFALSRLISPLGKLRMGLDLLIPPRHSDGDETLANFVKRRLGSEALDKIAEPLMSGIYNADADRQSLLATFPRFRDIEKKHGSLIRGMLRDGRRRKVSSTPPPGPKVSAFVSFEKGTQQLVEALVSRLQGNLLLETAVKAIQPRSDGTYSIGLSDGTQLDADAIILATPAYITAQLIHSIAPASARHLETIRYVSTGTVSLAFREGDIPEPLAGFGIVIPSSEKKPINAITVSSTKFDHRAPQGYVLIRVFFGGSRSPGSIALDDEALMRMVQAELQSILHIEATPLFHRIYRWLSANPQYDVGHLERVAAIRSNLPSRVYVTGSAYHGVGVPDCVYQAQQTAEALITQLCEAGDEIKVRDR